MSTGRLMLKLVATTSLLILGSPELHAAGYSIYEQGAKASAMAGAFTAQADDPSAMFYNVAGLAHLRESEAYIGATLITFNAEFESDPQSPYPGGGVTEFYEDHHFVPPNAYAIMPIGENMTFGIGVYAAFGLRTDWDDAENFSGRYISSDANFKTASVQPSFAMKTSDGRFAWGIGAEYRFATVTLERNQLAVNPFTQRIEDVAAIRLESDRGDDWGWTAGLLFRPNDRWSIGLNYHAAMDIDVGGDAIIRQIPTGFPQFDAIVASQLPPSQPIATTIPFPSILQFGIATRSIPTWTIELDVVRMTWSAFDQVVVDFSNPQTPDLSIGETWNDVYSYRLGANKKVTDNWDVRLGAVFDENPQPTEAVGPLLPDSDRTGITFGFGWSKDRWTVDLSEMVLIFDPRSTQGRNQNNFNGRYTVFANLLSLNVGYKF